MGREKNKQYKRVGERFAAIPITVFESEAFKSLTSRQRDLYIHCRAEQFHPKRYKPDKEDATKFYFNEAVWSDKHDDVNKRQGYGLYSKTPRHFYRDMDALIMCGFIRCVYCGANAKQRNIYQYSDKWKLYGKPGFEILPEEMTKSLLNKRRKETNLEELLF